jgi:hypothetical protein
VNDHDLEGDHIWLPNCRAVRGTLDDTGVSAYLISSITSTSIPYEALLGASEPARWAASGPGRSFFRAMQPVGPRISGGSSGQWTQDFDETVDLSLGFGPPNLVHTRLRFELRVADLDGGRIASLTHTLVESHDGILVEDCGGFVLDETRAPSRMTIISKKVLAFDPELHVQLVNSLIPPIWNHGQYLLAMSCIQEAAPDE